MGFEDIFELKFLLKFLVLFIPFALFVFSFAPSLKWKLVLSLGGVIGIMTSLSGASLRKRQ